MGAAVPALFLKLTPEAFEGVQQDLLAYCWVHDPELGRVELWPHFDRVLTGRPFAGMKLALWSFEVNYGNFSAALAAAVGQLRARAGARAPASTPEQPSPRNGLSGESSLSL
jgi:hypothetical protein